MSRMITSFVTRTCRCYCSRVEESGGGLWSGFLGLGVEVGALWFDAQAYEIVFD